MYKDHTFDEMIAGLKELPKDAQDQFVRFMKAEAGNWGCFTPMDYAKNKLESLQHFFSTYEMANEQISNRDAGNLWYVVGGILHDLDLHDKTDFFWPLDELIKQKKSENAPVIDEEGYEEEGHKLHVVK